MPRWTKAVFLVLVLSSLAGCGNSAHVQVSGTASYEDLQYGTSGFKNEPTSYKPIRYAVVDLLDERGYMVGTTATDASGNFAFDNVVTGSYTVRLLAQTAKSSGFDVSVADVGTGATYAVTSPLVVGNQAVTTTLDVPSTSVGGVFNMLDVFTAATEFVHALSGGAQPSVPLVGYWAPGSATGTYTCNGYQSGCPFGMGIYIIGGYRSNGQDSDEYDDDVLDHEFGHYVEMDLGASGSPGGAHWVTDHTLDLRLAWSEGWGDYFSTAVRTWLKTNDPSVLSADPSLPTTYYVDTLGNQNVNLAFDFDAPDLTLCGSSGTVDCFIYDSNEVAVAKSLIDLATADGLAPLWSTESQYQPVTTNPISFETFWDGWRGFSGQANYANDQAILANRQITMSEDHWEPDGSIPTLRAAVDCTVAGTCLHEDHTLYLDNSSPDADYIAVTLSAGRSYTLYTTQLKNGADTYLQLLDNSGNSLASNDDASAVNCYVNNGSCLSSSITYTPSTTATYYIRVSTTPGPLSLFAGRYGAYTLVVQ